MTIVLRPVRAGLALLLTLAWLAAAVPVSADAELTATFPEAGATLDAAPTTVAARFSEEIGDESELEVLGPDGSLVARGGVDPADPRRLIVRLDSPLPNGAYEVRWEAFSADGHLVRGTFAFTVAAATPSASPPSPPASGSPPAAPSATPDPTERPLPSPSAAPGPSPATGSDVLVPIVAAVLVVGGLGAFLLRGRRSRP